MNLRRILLLAALACAPLIATAQRISELPAATTPAGTELLSCVQGGVTKRCTVAQIIAGAQPLDADLTSIAGLADPGGDRVLFWDASAGGYRQLAIGSGLDLTGTTLTATGGGGGGGLANLVDDTTPQLGGNLDLNSFTVGVATAADLTKLNALTASAAQLNFVTGVTSAVQTQLDAKQALDSDLTAIAALTTTSFGRGLLDDADAAAARTSIGAVIGTDVQAYDADLTTLGGLAKTDDSIAVADGTTWQLKTLTSCSGATNAVTYNISTNAFGCNTISGGGGGGDASTNTASSVDSEIALFSSTTGKLLKRATISGILKGTSGVLSAAALSDVLALFTGTCNSTTVVMGNGACSSGTPIPSLSAAATLSKASDLFVGYNNTLASAAKYTPTQVGQTIVGAGPGADRIVFWDESAGQFDYLTAGSGLTITGTTITSSGGSGAPTTATYITQTADATLSAEQALSALATGIVKNTTTTGVLSIAAAGTDYVVPAGNVATATALAANGANCATDEIALGVTAAGVGEGCYFPVYTGSTTLSTSTTFTPNCSKEVTYMAMTGATGTVTIANPTGCTPKAGQKLIVALDATNSQTVAWGADFRAGATALPTAHTGSAKTDYYGFRWHPSGTENKWDYLSTAAGF